MRGLRPLAAVAGLAALGSCAAVSSPQGGPRDLVAPRLVATSPDSAARNVKQQYIRLTFSEPVQVKDLPKNLLITPQLASDNQYQLREDRNSVSLLFPKPLEANTTYSFNFRKAIVDITESTPAKYQALSFSTGPNIDSARVQGTVADLLTNRPVADASVGLYRVADTVGVRRGQPYYLTRTDSKGEFTLNFIKSGQYNLYAWGDKNNNGRYDDGEKIAYQPAPIALTDTTRAQTLLLVRPDRQPPRRTGVEPSASRVNLRFNEGLRTLSVVPVASAPPATLAAVQEAVDLGDNGTSAILYRTPALVDGRYLLAATDSAGNTARDTLNIRFPVPTATSKKAAPVAGTSVEGSPRSVFRQGQVKFKFPVPVRLVPGKPVGTLAEDSLKRRPLRLPADGFLSADRSSLTINLDTKAQKMVDISLDSTSIEAITGQSLGLRRPLRLTVTDIDPNGILLGTFTTKYPQFDLQLLDEQYKVVRQLRSPKGRYRFDHLPPGSYRFRVLIDQDGDGQWRGGDPDLRRPPEPVYVSPTLIKLRANFQLDNAVKLEF
ncbi:Ig-like domain-containing domain [Hymenobacter sp.]|uniref:Ig-like domain-containing domain n=1 Tax=Hymenobacter sp. TaxID=1898978 RepID=UPI002D7F8556|nr:Ig-like domain-containing domain [Hymenobacter sp.]